MMKKNTQKRIKKKTMFSGGGGGEGLGDTMVQEEFEEEGGSGIK